MLIKYIISINIITFLSMGYDKLQAKRNKWRIPEISLFLLAFLGGSLGGILGMIIFHHKTKKISFKILFPLFLIINIICLMKTK